LDEDVVVAAEVEGVFKEFDETGGGVFVFDGTEVGDMCDMGYQPMLLSNRRHGLVARAT